jgi:hypothetical protein
MPFGLANTPAAFWSYINILLRPNLNVFVIAYLDNIVVYSNMVEEHRRHVRTVLETLFKAGLDLKLCSRKFNAKEIRYMGFIVASEEVRKKKNDIATIEELSMLDSHHNIQVFLGFANFNRHFVKSFSRTVRPMTSLLKGSKEGKIFRPFKPTVKMQEVFQCL